MDRKHLASLWAGGRAEREHFLERGRESAALTLPHLAPDLDTRTKGKDLVRPYQSTGGDGVNNLASKLSVGLFPPSVPYFKYDLNGPALVAALERAGFDVDNLQGDPEQLARAQVQIGAIQLAYSKRERFIQQQMDEKGHRVRTFECLLHLLVNGNYCFRYLEDGTLMGYRLDQFMVWRDAMDRVWRVITREVVDREALPEDKREKAAASSDLEGMANGRDMVDVYTCSELLPGSKEWQFWQEDSEGMVLKEKVKLSDDEQPMIPIRMFPDSNENYGRSWAEIRYSDLKGHEGLSQSILEVAAMASRVVRIIDPGANITPKELHKVPNGGAVIGDGTKIVSLGVDKIADMSIAGSVNDTLRQRLDQGFLRFSPRNAERVTGEEIRETVRELNEALGGAMATMAQELQLPLVRKMEAILDRQNALPGETLEGVTGIKVVTGIDAIGRGRDEVAMNGVIGSSQQVFGPEVAADYINAGEYYRRMASYRGLDPEGLIRTEEEVLQRQQQRADRALAERVGPNIVNAAASAQNQEG